MRAVNDHTFDVEPASEQSCRGRNIARQHRFPDFGAADRFVVVTDSRQRGYAKAERFTKLGELLDITGTILAQRKVRTDHNFLEIELRHHARQKLFRRLQRKLAIEREDIDDIDPGRGQQPGFLLSRADASEESIRTQHHHRHRLEREHGRLRSQFARSFDGCPNQMLMATVNAIERADRDHRRRSITLVDQRMFYRHRCSPLTG